MKSKSGVGILSGTRFAEGGREYNKYVSDLFVVLFFIWNFYLIPNNNSGQKIATWNNVKTHKYYMNLRK